MKRLNSVAFIVATLLHICPPILLPQGEILESAASSLSSASKHHQPAWVVSEEDDEIDDMDEEDESKLLFWDRMAKRYQEAKVMAKMAYNAKVRPFLRDHKEVLYGTAGLASTLLLLYGIKKMKEGSKPAAAPQPTQ